MFKNYPLNKFFLKKVEAGSFEEYMFHYSTKNLKNFEISS